MLHLKQRRFITLVLPSGIEPKMQAAALSETGNKRGGIGCVKFRLKQKGEINRVFGISFALLIIPYFL